MAAAGQEWAERAQRFGVGVELRDEHIYPSVADLYTAATAGGNASDSRWFPA
jgi:hypothetical protein